MSQTWVATVAAACVTVIVSVASMYTTFKTGKRQQQTALEIAHINIDGQLAQLREERDQRRLEAAYNELLMMLSEAYQWAVSVYPTWASGRENYTMPPMPERSGKARAEAVVTAAWSPRVQQLMEPWRNALSSVYNKGGEMTRARNSEARGQESGIDLAGSLRELRERKDAVWRADEAIREQVWLELRGKHDGHAEPANG